MGKFSKRIESLRGKLSKAQFAASVGIARTALVAYEKAKDPRTPSSEVLIKLGNFGARCGKYQEAVWFWTEAGMDVRAAESTFGNRVNATATAAGGGDDRPYKVLPTARAGLSAPPLPPINLPYSMLPHPESARYAELSDTHYAPIFRAGGVVVIDESDIDLKKLRGKCVAFYRRPEREASEIAIRDARTGKRSVQALGPIRREGVFVGLVPSRGADLDNRVGVVPTSVLVPSVLGALFTEDLKEWDGEGDGAVVLGAVIAWIPARMQSSSTAKKGKR